jgi:hypothetical protein
MRVPLGAPGPLVHGSGLPLQVFAGSHPDTGCSLHLVRSACVCAPLIIASSAAVRLAVVCGSLLLLLLLLLLLCAHLQDLHRLAWSWGSCGGPAECS